MIWYNVCERTNYDGANCNNDMNHAIAGHLLKVTQILCIAMGDLNINAENTEQFSYEHMVFGRYLDDIVTGG